MKNPNILVSSTYGTIILNRNDHGVADEVLDRGCQDAEVVKYFDALIKLKLVHKDQVTFYDVGAHIGSYSLALSKLNPHKIRVRAFEAQRPIFNMLCGNMAINGLINVYCHNNAVSDVDGDKIEIRLPDYDAICNFGSFEVIMPAKTDNYDMIKSVTENIETVTIDHFFECIDFIKMDIEGMEDRALRGAVRTITTHRPICYLELFKTDLSFVASFFKDIGYTSYYKDGNAFFVPQETTSPYLQVLSPFQEMLLT